MKTISRKDSTTSIDSFASSLSSTNSTMSLDKKQKSLENVQQGKNKRKKIKEGIWGWVCSLNEFGGSRSWLGRSARGFAWKKLIGCVETRWRHLGFDCVNGMREKRVFWNSEIKWPHLYSMPKLRQERQNEHRKDDWDWNLHHGWFLAFSLFSLHRAAIFARDLQGLNSQMPRVWSRDRQAQFTQLSP